LRGAAAEKRRRCCNLGEARPNNGAEMSGMISELATQAQMKAIIALLIVPVSATMVFADDYQIFTLNAVPGSRQHYSYGALVVNENQRRDVFMSRNDGT
jgi:hypothetical protein